MNKEIKKLNDEILKAKADSFNMTHVSNWAHEIAYRAVDDDIFEKKLALAIEAYKSEIESKRLVEKLTEQYRVAMKIEWTPF